MAGERMAGEVTASEDSAASKARTFLAELGKRAIEVGRVKASSCRDQALRMRVLLREAST